MLQEYVQIPKIVRYRDIINNNYRLSAKSFKKTIHKHKLKSLRSFIKSYNIGKEVGSFSYINKSPKYFIKPSSFQSELYTFLTEKESVIPILPEKFKDYKLKAGDILISKDSNVGECVILEKDYPYHTIAGGVVRIKVDEPYVIMGLIKHQFFMSQFEKGGVTITHAKTKFFDFQIPYPNKDEDKEFIEKCVKSIVKIEIEIINKLVETNKIVANELKQNSKISPYSFPKYSNIKNNVRVSAGIYCEEYKNLISIIKNYKNGFFTISEDK